jgi:hypothetical protein
VRNTAEFPIAALSDGAAFRNSLLAILEVDGWSPPATISLLNSTLVRWLHYHRFREARQKALPQVKIGHLRQIPSCSPEFIERLKAFGLRFPDTIPGTQFTEELRYELDDIIFEAFQLTSDERALVRKWWIGRKTKKAKAKANA